MDLPLGRPPGKEELPRSIDHTTLAHLYRAEVGRSTDWRTRLDTTTNWAITSAAAVVSLSFSSSQSPHATLLVGLVLVCVFLFIETRRYRYYDLWARRVRLIETAYLAPLLRREVDVEDFHAALASELARPRLRISTLDSLTFRLRRTYASILAMLMAAWVVKLDMHPAPPDDFREIIGRAAIGPIPGGLVWLLWAAFGTALVYLLVRAFREPLPVTELRAPTRQRHAQLGPALRRLARPPEPLTKERVGEEGEEAGD